MQNHAFSFTGAFVSVELNQLLEKCIYLSPGQNAGVVSYIYTNLGAKMGDGAKNHAIFFTATSVSVEFNQPLEIRIFHLPGQNTDVLSYRKTSLLIKVERF